MMDFHVDPEEDVLPMVAPNTSIVEMIGVTNNGKRILSILVEDRPGVLTGIRAFQPQRL